VIKQIVELSVFVRNKTSVCLYFPCRILRQLPMHRLFSRCWNLQVTLYAYSCHTEMGSTWCGLNVIRPRPWPGSVLQILAAEFSRFLWGMIQVVMSHSIPSWLPVSLDFVKSEPQFSMSLSDHNSGVYTVCVGAICAAISVFDLSRSLPYRMHHIRPCYSFFLGCFSPLTVTRRVRLRYRSEKLWCVRKWTRQTA
jgi:hypothetical protein